MKYINFFLLAAFTAAVMVGCTKEHHISTLDIVLAGQEQFDMVGTEYKADLHYAVSPAPSGNLHAEVLVEGDHDGFVRSEICPGAGQDNGTVHLVSPRRLPDVITVTLRVSEDGRTWYESNPVVLRFEDDIWTVIPADPEE